MNENIFKFYNSFGGEEKNILRLKNISPNF